MECCKLNTKYNQRVTLVESYYRVEWLATLHRSNGQRVHREAGSVEIKNRDKLEEYREQAKLEGKTALEVATQNLSEPLLTFK